MVSYFGTGSCILTEAGLPNIQLMNGVNVPMPAPESIRAQPVAFCEVDISRGLFRNLIWIQSLASFFSGRLGNGMGKCTRTVSVVKKVFWIAIEVGCLACSLGRR